MKEVKDLARSYLKFALEMCMSNPNNDLYVYTLTLDKVSKFLEGKSEHFIGVFWKAFSDIRKEMSTNEIYAKLHN